MSANRLLSLIADQGGKPKRAAVARWTETPVAGAWEPEPDYGAFVDEHGVTVPGSEPARAVLKADDPSRLELAASLAGTSGRLVFVDWGRQPLSWNEIFSIWEQWEKQGLIEDCGAVATAWSLNSHWLAPGWILFKEEFDGAPLKTTAVAGLLPAPETPKLDDAELAPPKVQSFLAIAKALRGEKVSFKGVPAGNFPMIPFTLEALRNPSYAWPQGL
jgi:hypothetical protein